MSKDYLVGFVTNLISHQRQRLDPQFAEHEWARHQRTVERLVRDGALPPSINNKFEMMTMVRHVLDDLKHADMYFVGKEFTEILDDYYRQIFNVLEEPPFVQARFDPISCLPSPLCFIVIDQLQGVDQKRLGFLCRETEDGAIDIRLVTEYGFPLMCGGYKIGGGLMFPSGFEQALIENFTTCIAGISGAFSLINNPRFVIQSPAGTRQQRKAAKKGHGVPVEAWHKISWNIDEPVQPRDGDSRTFNMPLHYTRGHWRRNAKEDWKDVEFIKGQWMQWIKGYWSGHPAFGIKKGYHVPKIGRAA